MTTPESTIQTARIEAAARAILDDNPFNDEPNLWEVPSIRAHYTAIATVALAAADAAGPSKPHTITTVEELDALPASTRVWGSSHLQPGIPATGSPYEKQDDGEWWDFGNQYDVGSDDILLPALVIEVLA